MNEDRNVNSENFDPEEITITYTADYTLYSKNTVGKTVLLGKEINTPTITCSYTILPSIEVEDKSYTDKTGKQIINRKEVKTFLDNPDNRKLRDLNGYKDSDGRIWDFNVSDNIMKVTYPNGSYLNYDEGNVGFQINYSDGRQLFYNEKLGYSIDNLVFIWSWDRNKAKDLFCKYMNSFPPQGHISQDDFYAKSEGLSSSELGDHINKSLNALVDNKNTPSTVRSIKNNERDYGTILGYMEDGTYVSKEEHDAKLAAEQAAAQKELNANLAFFTKRFGFNPDGKSAKQIITSGRSFSLVKEWYNFRKEHKASYYFFNLSDDLGSDKCYGIYYAKDYFSNRGKRQGYVWVKGDKITSVSWN